MFKSYAVVVSLCAAVLSTGCVSSAKYEMVQKDLDQITVQKNIQEKEVVRLKEHSAKLTEDLIAEKGKNTELESDKRILEGKKSKLDSKIEGLNTEMQDLENTKNNLAKAVATVTGNLEEAKEREKTIAAQLKITQADLASALRQKKETEEEKAALESKLDEVNKHLGECATLAEGIQKDLKSTGENLKSLQQKLNYQSQSKDEEPVTIKVSDEAQKE